MEIWHRQRNQNPYYKINDDDNPIRVHVRYRPIEYPDLYVYSACTLGITTLGHRAWWEWRPNTIPTEQIQIPCREQLDWLGRNYIPGSFNLKPVEPSVECPLVGRISMRAMLAIIDIIGRDYSPPPEKDSAESTPAMELVLGANHELPMMRVPRTVNHVRPLVHTHSGIYTPNVCAYCVCVCLCVYACLNMLSYLGNKFTDRSPRHPSFNTSKPILLYVVNIYYLLKFDGSIQRGVFLLPPFVLLLLVLWCDDPRKLFDRHSSVLKNFNKFQSKFFLLHTL